jgi:hypothetical protein
MTHTHTHTHTHTYKIDRIPLEEGWAYHINLYLTTHNSYQGQKSMPPVEFEPAIPASELTQTYALERVATGTGSLSTLGINLLALELDI